MTAMHASSTGAMRQRIRLSADDALAAAARLWFATATIGQWAFLYYLVVFYGSATLHENFQAWTRNKDLFKSFVAGDTAGNLSFAAHVMLAATIAFGGTLQLIPHIRARAPAVHRWNGRIFLVTALGGAITGLYMVWVRGDRPTLIGGLALSLNATLMIVFVVLAWRTARRRNIAAHREWALRCYLVSNAQWFMRIGVFGWIAAGIGGLAPFYLCWMFGCYLVPLGMLELYLRSRRGAGQGRRYAMAAGLVMTTLLMSVGIVGLYMAERPLM